MDQRFVGRYGPWAVVTGASSGIGAEFARQLAMRGVSLVLCARRRERLEELGQQLQKAHGIETRSVELDVGRSDFVGTLQTAISGLDVGLLVSNAGFGEKGPFLDSDLARDLFMIDVNCRAHLMLAHAFSKVLVARGRGGIIFTSSTAAFQGLPFTTHYAATKGYVLQLSEGLWFELRPHGVDVLALCPGPTDTEGPRRSGVNPDQVPVKMMEVEPVVKAALDGLGHTSVVVPGGLNKVSGLLTRMLPRRTVTALAGRLMERVTRK